MLAVCLILAAGIYFIGISMLFGRHYEPNLIISSPDGQYELVIREYSCLGGVGADIYIRGTEWYNIWKKLDMQAGMIIINLFPMELIM